MASLLEAYAKRLAVSESVYSKSHSESMPQSKKLVIAKCLENTSKFINEAFENSTGTQRSSLGDFKKFTLNLVTVALPDLIAFDLVMVQPMSSITGYVAYIKYTAGTNKGNTKQGDIFNDPWRLGKVDTEYTSERVAETVKIDENGKAFLAWAPVVNTETVKPELVGAAEGAAIEVVDAKTGEVKITGVTGTEAKVRYVYDNIVIPQNDLPILNAEMASITLSARARRIAIYYSQIANYQAKTDYGFDLGDQLAQKAVGQLNYEIDTEITDLLINNADSDGDLVWSKTLPYGVSKMEHYEGFTEIVAIAKQKIYDRTKRHAPNYMLIASNILPILSMVKAFSAAPASSVNGPYFAGTLDGLKVFVTPNIEPGKFVLGVNNGALETSAAVYAPYMPVVPTQLLGFADGSMSQGWSTMYDLQILNKDLLVSGRVTA